MLKETLKIFLKPELLKPWVNSSINCHQVKDSVIRVKITVYK